MPRAWAALARCPSNRSKVASISRRSMSSSFMPEASARREDVSVICDREHLVNQPGARSSACTGRRRKRTLARVTRFSSSRTFPGQSYWHSKSRAAGSSSQGLFCIPRGCDAEKVLDEQRHVFFPLPQRRHHDRHHGQPIVQIWRKPPFGDVLANVPIGRRTTRTSARSIRWSRPAHTSALAKLATAWLEGVEQISVISSAG